MESGVKHTHLGHVGHKGRDGLDAGHVGGIVERGQVVALAYHVFDLVGDEHTLGKFLGAVYHAVTDGVDLGIRTDAALGRVGEDAQDSLDGTLMVGAAQLKDSLGAVGTLVFEETVGEADFLHTALGHGTVGGGVDELVLYRAAARVDYEYLHFLTDYLEPIAWQQVSMMVL